MLDCLPWCICILQTKWECFGSRFLVHHVYIFLVEKTAIFSQTVAYWRRAFFPLPIPIAFLGRTAHTFNIHKLWVRTVYTVHSICARQKWLFCVVADRNYAHRLDVLLFSIHPCVIYVVCLDTPMPLCLCWNVVQVQGHEFVLNCSIRTT